MHIYSSDYAILILPHSSRHFEPSLSPLSRLSSCEKNIISNLYLILHVSNFYYILVKFLIVVYKVVVNITIILTSTFEGKYINKK